MDNFEFTDLPRGAESVLLVDTNRNALRICQLLFKSLGYSVTALDCPASALGCFKDDPKRYDVVITEMDMQPMAGNKLAESLRRIRPGLPVIAHTAILAPVYRQAFLAVVRKPASFMEMATALRQVLDSDTKTLIGA